MKLGVKKRKGEAKIYEYTSAIDLSSQCNILCLIHRNGVNITAILAIGGITSTYTQI